MKLLYVSNNFVYNLMNFYYYFGIFVMPNGYAITSGSPYDVLRPKKGSGLDHYVIDD